MKIILLVLLTLTLSINESFVSFDNEPREGNILFSPLYDTSTYLIDYVGNVIHTWESEYYPGGCSYMLNDNTIIRSMCLTLTSVYGKSDGVQKIARDGTVLWEYINRYSHHDIEVLPNGNVLMIVREHKTMDESISAGRDPMNVTIHGIDLDYIIEVKPTGRTSGDIVWEWHVWDHLIQDYDPTKKNYGVVKDHPELIDINYVEKSNDLTHFNSVDYNSELNQILISCRHYNEIWIVERGVDNGLLYRWGNPQTYKRGIEEDQIYYYQHDAQWIQEGCPGEGNILVFNNGDAHGIRKSAIIEIKPPVDNNGNYAIESGHAFEPFEPVWIYENGEDFFSPVMSGSQRLPSGNTLICESRKGRFFEVTPDGNIVWEYTNPYPNSVLNMVFKIEYILPTTPIPDLDCIGNITWYNLKPSTKLNATFSIQNIGTSDSVLNWEIKDYPSWGVWTFNPDEGEGLKPDDGTITVDVSCISPEITVNYTGNIMVVNIDNVSDYGNIPVQMIVDDPPEPNLDCKGNIHWNRVSPGSFLNDNITVENIGESNSLLDWEISDYPDWGTWFFSPENGVNLKPEDGNIYVDIWVRIPNVNNTHLSGTLKISNINNPNDFEIIPVHIYTARANFFNFNDFSRFYRIVIVRNMIHF